MDREIKDPRLELAARIERHRRDRGLTTKQLAERAQVDQGQMDTLLRGAGDIGVLAIVRLAGALGIDTEELIGGIDETPGT